MAKKKKSFMGNVLFGKKKSAKKHSSRKQDLRNYDTYDEFEDEDYEEYDSYEDPRYEDEEPEYDESYDAEEVDPEYNDRYDAEEDEGSEYDDRYDAEADVEPEYDDRYDAEADAEPEYDDRYDADENVESEYADRYDVENESYDNDSYDGDLENAEKGVLQENIYEDEIDDDPEEDLYEDGYDAAMEEDPYEESVREHRRSASGKKKGKSRRKKKENAIVAFLKDSTPVEQAAILFGVVIIIVGISVGTLYADARSRSNVVASFQKVGTELQGTTIIGEAGLTALSDAAQAAAIAQQEIEEEIEEEEDKEDGIEVRMSLSTIKQDLKIKFMNRSTGKLIASVPFEVKVSGPSGEVTYTDDDKDGIIYKSGLQAGNYKVTMVSLGDNYEDYIVDSETQSIAVKDTIAYKKVDVSDEIKTESQVNAAKEDTKVNDTPVESVKTDTVEWVESTKTEIGTGDANGGYQAIDKSTIVDPTTTSMAKSISLNGLRQFAESDGYSLSLSGGGTIASGSTGTVTASVSAPEGKETPSVSWSSDNEGVATVSGGTVTAKSVTSDTTVTITAKISYTLETTTKKEVGTGEYDEEGNEIMKEEEETSKEDKTLSESVTITVAAQTYTLSSASISSDTILVGNTATLSATTSPEGGNVSWTSSDTGIATVSGTTVTGVKAGSVTLTAKCGDSTKTVSLTVKENTGDAKISLSPSKLTMVAGSSTTETITPTVSGVKDTTVTWSSSDSSIASVSDKGVVTALKEGTATITATLKADTKVTATSTVTVLGAGGTLKDKNGNTVYIKKDGAFVAATVADYYTAKEFYIATVTKNYKYTGWQTIDGKKYYYDKNGVAVTGTQTIQGIDYTFGSDGALSGGAATMGIDVSKWNGNIDWNAVKNSGVEFAIIRCGYRGSSTGALVVDPKFKANIAGAQAAGIKVGVYFFSQAINDVEAVEEASMVAQLCSGYKLSLPVYLDVEAAGGRADGISKETRTTVCKTFCATIQDSGYRAGIYANKTWLTSKINTASLTGYRIWLAQYAAAPTYSATRYDMWQYSSKGSVSGISGNVDMNILY